MKARRAWAAPALSAAAALAVYANSLRGGFVYDDWAIVADNPLVRSGAWRALLASTYWSRAQAATSGGLYRPLTLLTYVLNSRWAGPAPFSFHAVNVLLHAANAALTAALAATLGLPAAAAAACGVAFAVLPVHTEAVAWVVGRAELLACFFSLSAWLCLYRSASPRRVAAGLLLFAAALLSKESAAALPAALALSEALAPREPWRRLVERRAPVWGAMLMIVGLYLEWRHFMLGSALTVGHPYFAGTDRLTVLLTMSRFFWAKWLAPMASGVGLCADYSRPVFRDARPGDAAAWLWLAAALTLAAWAAVDFARRRRPVSLGVLVLLALAAPLSNLLAGMEIIGAERVMYLPSVGFCLALGALSARPTARKTAAALVAALLAWWAWSTARRNPVWRSDDAFWEATVACAPTSPRALVGMGERQDAHGRHAQAREYYRRALASDPAFVEAIFDEARSFLSENADADARRAVERALSLRSDAGSWCLLGILDERAGRGGDAERDYERAVARDPAYALARRNLGVLLYKRGKPDEAHEQLAAYLRLFPPQAEAEEIRAFLRRGFKAAGKAPPRPSSRR